MLEVGTSATEIRFFRQAMASPQAKQWKVAELKDIHSLEQNDDLKPVILPDDQNLITAR